MRFPKILLLTLALAACGMVDTPTANGPVDANNLPPLSSREQSLIYGAQGAMAQNNNDAAEKDYMNAVALSNGHIEAHIALAQLYEKQNQPEKEAAILDRALILQPDSGLANYMRGKLYLDSYHYSEALASFERGLRTRPDDLDLNTGKGIANDMLGNHIVAQMTYLRAMQVNPKSNVTTLKTDLAMSYMLGGDPKKAVAVLEPEVRKPGASSVTRQDLALAYGMLGRNAEAKKLLNGEIDEETRTLAVARMREYVKDNGDGTPPINGIVTTPAAASSVAKVKPVSMKTDHSAMAKAIAAEEKKKKAAAATGPTAAQIKAAEAAKAAAEASPQ